MRARLPARSAFFHHADWVKPLQGAPALVLDLATALCQAEPAKKEQKKTDKVQTNSEILSPRRQAIAPIAAFAAFAASNIDKLNAVFTLLSAMGCRSDDKR